MLLCILNVCMYMYFPLDLIPSVFWFYVNATTVTYIIISLNASLKFHIVFSSHASLFSGLPNPSEWYLTKSHGLQVLMSGKSKVNHDTHTSILVHPYVAVLSQTHAQRVFVSIIHYIHTTTLGFALYNDKGLACWTDILHACIEQGEGSWWSQHTGVLHMSSVHL